MGARPGEAARAFSGMVREREHGDLGGVTDGTWRSWSVSAGAWCRSVKPASAIGSRRWPSALTSPRDTLDHGPGGQPRGQVAGIDSPRSAPGRIRAWRPEPTLGFEPRTYCLRTPRSPANPIVQRLASSSCTTPGGTRWHGQPRAGATRLADPRTPVFVGIQLQLGSTREPVLRNHPHSLVGRRGFEDLGAAHLGADALERHAGGQKKPGAQRDLLIRVL